MLEPWKSFFTEIDNSLHEELALHCLGGFVMTMLYGLARPTADVDVLPLGVNFATDSLMRLAGEGSALHKKCGVYLQIIGVAQIPLGYEDRLTEMFAKTFNHLRLFALDPYDLALSKIERNTQRDRDDVKRSSRYRFVWLRINTYRHHLSPNFSPVPHIKISNPSVQPAC